MTMFSMKINQTKFDLIKYNVKTIFPTITYLFTKIKFNENLICYINSTLSTKLTTKLKGTKTT